MTTFGISLLETYNPLVAFPNFSANNLTVKIQKGATDQSSKKKVSMKRKVHQLKMVPLGNAVAAYEIVSMHHHQEKQWLSKTEKNSIDGYKFKTLRGKFI